MTRKSISQEFLKSILRYEPITGDFFWLVDHKNSMRAGDSAGTLDKSTGYLRIGIDGVQYRANRLAWLYMKGVWPLGHIDHEDRIRTNNIWTNLREVSPSGNSRNQKLRSTNTSRVMGVQYYNPKHKTSKPWLAHICVAGKYKHIGYFADWFDAVCARKSAEVTHNYHPNHGAI